MVTGCPKTDFKRLHDAVESTRTMTDSSTFDLQTPQQITIVGAGLLGGSFGLACRQQWPGSRVVGLSRSDRSRQQALDCGAVTEVTADLRAACEDADWIIIATPVQQIAPIAIEAAEIAAMHSREPLIMDLGSTKASIVRRIDGHPVASRCFVGAHPIAGSEKTGAAHARADLFRCRVVVVTPTLQTARGKLHQAKAIWKQLQANIVEMTPESHDEALACVSHLPHLMASMMAGVLPASMHQLVGTGWLDTTRVASGDPELWSSICRENSEAILAQLDAAKRWIERLAGQMKAGEFDQVRNALTEAKVTRDAIQLQCERNER